MFTENTQYRMTATPHSEERYHPLFLANGDDCVLIDYSGSSFVSKNGHSHFEQHQGAPCGWYNSKCRTKTRDLQPIFISGVQVVMGGAPAEPSFYEQSFDPMTATVRSILTFAYTVKVSIEGFITDEGLWCETVTAVEVPDSTELSIGFQINNPHPQMRFMSLPSAFTLDTHPSNEEISFDYTCGDFSGKGFLRPSKPFEYIKTGGPFGGHVGFYDKVKTGFSVSRITACVDESESDVLEKLHEKAVLFDLDSIATAHARVWEKYFSTSSVSLPDKKLLYEYNLSRYVVRATQHKVSGLCTCGFFPNLWGGDVCCSYDADFSMKAFFSSGNIDEGEKYVKSYEFVSHQGYEILKAHGMSGETFLGWQNGSGDYVGPVDPFEGIINFKPCYNGYFLVAVYGAWKKNRNFITENTKKLIRDVLVFLRGYMIKDTSEDVAYIKEVKVGTEAGFSVKVDTFTQLLYAVGFKAAGEILGDVEAIEFSRKLMNGLADNYREDGVLMPYENSLVLGGLQTECYMLTMPDSIDFINIIKLLEACTTEWGIDSDQTSETYRHWPWNDTKVAVCATHEGESALAMKHILHLMEGASSIGALPEKIRLDGEPIGFWYTSTHALVVWTLNDAFAFTKHTDKNDICLAYGFNKPWKDFSCRDISVDNMIFVSYEVKDGEFVSLSVRNGGNEKRKISLCFNNVYAHIGIPSEITLEPQKTATFKAERS